MSTFALTELMPDQTIEPIQRSYLPAGDSKLYYESWGRGAPLVLIHGNMLDGRMWDVNMGELSSRHRVIRYDMRGYGRSGPSVGRFGDAIRDLKLLLDGLGLERVAICGTSMGGVVALHFALEYPERCDRLILVDADLSGFRVSAEFADAFLETRQALADGDTARAAEIWVNHPMLRPVQRYPEAFDYLKRIIADYNWENWTHSKTCLIDPPALRRLHEVAPPTLVMTGVDDLPRFHAIADEFERKLPDCSRIILAEASHLPNMEVPNQFHGHLLDFLEKKR